MRAHDHDLDETASSRPKGARVEEPDLAPAKAAAHGRWDVMHPGGMLDLQRTVGNAGVSEALADEERSPVHDVIGSGGRALDPEVRADMESRLGHDFGDVRVHDDSRAHESAVAVNAHAYTVGSDIVFQQGRYDPASQNGKVTLAHELTHVVQQRAGAVDGTPAAGGISVSDPGDRFEREASANAERVMSGPAPEVATPAPAAAPAPSATGVQREVAEESDEPAEEQPAAEQPATEQAGAEAPVEEEEPA